MKIRGRDEAKSESEKKLGKRGGRERRWKGFQVNAKPAFYLIGQRSSVVSEVNYWNLRRSDIFVLWNQCKKPNQSKNAKHLCSYDHNEYVFFKMSDIFFQKFPLRQS